MTDNEKARDIAWSRWVDNIERSLGYSLDRDDLGRAWEMWQGELTAREAADRVRASKEPR